MACVAVAHTITPFIDSNDAGNLTKIDDPDLPSLTANSVSFNAASNRLMVTSSAPKSIITYRIIDGVFVRVSARNYQQAETTDHLVRMTFI